MWKAVETAKSGSRLADRMEPRRIVVLGGGAAGFFGAIRAAELDPDAQVILLEATRTPLQKVRISGGGRCNVTHNMFDPAQLVLRYPRGAKELRGVLSRFGPRETMQWFESRGVPLKVEEDGRVFPTTDDSETICQCLLREAEKARVEVRVASTLTGATRSATGFSLAMKGGESMEAHGLLLASGSNPSALGLAEKLGHTVVPGVPSLFTFEVQDARIEGLAGIAVPHVRAKAILPTGTFEQEGPMLVTHWGLSAHAVLRLSAWGARAFHDADYRGTLVVDWLPEVGEPALRERAAALRVDSARGTVGAHPLAPELPRRLWERLVVAAGGDPAIRWAEVPNRGLQALLDELKRGRFEITGKGPFREEFVTAGGIERREVEWRTMESRMVPGLHFAGEILDVDALTGGFNLQNAWSTGWVAGTSLGSRGKH